MFVSAIIGLVIAALISGAIWYFAAGGLKSDQEEGGHDGCVVSLILGLICALLVALFEGWFW